MSREFVMFLVGFAIGLWIALAVLGIFGDRDRTCPVVACCAGSCDGTPRLPGVPLPGENREEGDNPKYFCSLDEEGDPIVVDDEGEPVVVDDASEGNEPVSGASLITPPGQRTQGEYLCATDAEGEPIVVDDEGDPIVVDEEGEPATVDEEGEPNTVDE